MPAERSSEFPLDMNAEVKARQAQPERRVDAETSTEIAARIGELLKQSGIDDERNPLAAEKIQRDLNYQRQIEQLPQPESAPLSLPTTTPELDRLEELQRKLEDKEKEAAVWKTRWGQKTGDVGTLKRQVAELEAQVRQIAPALNVQQITGREPNEPITAQDAVNLLMSQSTAFGNVINQVREEMRNAQSAAQSDALPLDIESELVEAHPWLTDLPRPQKMRAMHDILASAGVSIAPQAPGVAPGPARQPSVLPEAARSQVKQAAFIEPSNRGSAAERNAIVPERQALNEKVSKLKELLHGQYKPGASDRAAELLASLGAGPVDETQEGFLSRRR